MYVCLSSYAAAGFLLALHQLTVCLLGWKHLALKCAATQGRLTDRFVYMSAAVSAKHASVVTNGHKPHVEQSTTIWQRNGRPGVRACPVKRSRGPC